MISFAETGDDMGYWIKKISPIVLAALIACSVLMFSLLAVGKTTGNAQKGTIAEGSLPLGKYEETIDVTVGQMVSATSYVAGESADKNVMYDLAREVLNVNFKSVFSANIGTAYDYQLNTYILDGKVPDLFFCSQNQLSDLIDQGMVQDITEIYEEYASPGLRLAMEYSYTGDISVWNDGNPALPRSTVLMDAASKNGKCYGLPFLSDLFEKCPLIWIRTDWFKKYLDSKNISYTDDTVNDYLPADFGEYLEVVEYFTTQDPDGNKQNDTYGFSCGFTAANLNGIANVYGAYPGYYVKDGEEKFYYGTDDEKMRDVINLLNRLYNEGHIEKNSAFDGQTLKKALASGKIGTFLGEYWSVMSYGLSDAYLIDQNIDWMPWAIRDYDGNVIEPLVPYNISNNAFYCIGKDCVNPEVLILLANHLVDRYFSDEGEFTKRIVEICGDEKYRSVESELEMYLPFRMDAPQKNLRYAFDLQKAFATNDTSHLTLHEITYYNNIKLFLDDPKGAGRIYYPYYKIFCKNGAYSELTKYADYDYEKDKNYLKVNFKRPGFVGMNTPEMATYNSLISDYEEQQLIYMYVSPAAVTPERWKTFSDGIKNKGVSEILRGLNGV